MKNILISTALVVATAATAVAQTVVTRDVGSLTTIGGWDFNGNSGTTSLVFNARYNQQYTPYFTAGNGPSPGSSTYGQLNFNANGADFGSARSISTSNASNYDLLSTDGLLVSNNSLGDVVSGTGRSVLLSTSAVSNNNKAVFTLSTLTTANTFTGINVAYAARNQGSAGNDAAIAWSYSFDGSSWNSISGSSDTIAPSGSAYNAFAADFSAVTAIEGLSTVYIGLDYSETAAGASVFLDNVAFYGTAAAIPEPSSYAALAGVAALGLVAARRRRSSK
jgi:hypothetical protein